ncbi:GNAT family N-acetyltransferase [Crenobacter cavernae]|uniref:GNAT family N-acetyltransferase n=1 Tax=Crenobacter cavernae TaxID=2290923 RepID=A0A345Y787_9NEIS|nr:GNAT family N-acetyltransferase [Crenobacter cavernae]AXK39789.1 GNAT family N-acetyltransferase [Crenobacter cavernae]
MKITLDTLADADIPACHALFVDAVHRLGQRHYRAEQCAAWAPQGEMPDSWRDGWARRLSRAWGVKALSEDGRLAGFAWLLSDGEFDMLFVAPWAAGQGVGTRLVGALVYEANAAGLAELTAYASHGARPVFERAGFTMLRDNLVWRDGVAIENWIMKKALPGREAT